LVLFCKHQSGGPEGGGGKEPKGKGKEPPKIDKNKVRMAGFVIGLVLIAE